MHFVMSSLFVHWHLHCDLLYICDKLQCFSCTVHWHLHPKCSSSSTSSLLTNAIRPFPTKRDFVTLNVRVSVCVGWQLSCFDVQHPPHLLMRVHVGKYITFGSFVSVSGINETIVGDGSQPAGFVWVLRLRSTSPYRPAIEELTCLV